MSDLTTSTCWQTLQACQQSMETFSLVDAMQKDPARPSKMSCQASELFLDYSKQLIDDESFSALIDLAHQQGVPNAIQQMRNGDNINPSEQRQALHYLLRANDKSTLPTNLHDYLDDVVVVKQRMYTLADAIYTGKQSGYTGKAFTDIVNIGIGGSDLGPAMVYQALRPLQPKNKIRCHFISNISPSDICECLSHIDPETTLFIVSSKSFTTTETLSNAEVARDWVVKQLGDAATPKHFIGVTSCPDKAVQWGIGEQNIYPLWDWVGGRYSVWSAIGFSLAASLGSNTFEELLAGAREMDEHFFTTELENNLPVIMGLLGVWYSNFWHRQTHAVIPYDHRLRRFTAYLQQLEMESNGKCISNQKRPLDYTTCPELWGEAGTNAQHSFFQRLHQGTSFTPIDFIAVIETPCDLPEHQKKLFTSCLAQSRALMLGKTSDETDFDTMPGNRPSNTLVLQALTPRSLGALIAAYEHKVYVQSVVWDINPFDQWGVELGKRIGKDILAALSDQDKFDELDPSTQGLLDKFQPIDSRKT